MKTRSKDCDYGLNFHGHGRLGYVFWYKMKERDNVCNNSHFAIVVMISQGSAVDATTISVENKGLRKCLE